LETGSWRPHAKLPHQAEASPDLGHRAIFLSVGEELGARVSAFDATDSERLERFFEELPSPIDTFS